MKNEEIKELCTKNNLTRMEVYDIRSQFISMCMISEGYVDDEHSENSEPTSKGPANKLGQRDGINMNYFMRNCSFLAGTLPNISKRLLIAIGNYIYG